MYTQGTGCLFTYDPSIKEILKIHSRAFEVPNTYVRWEGREVFITRFVPYGEKPENPSAIAWDNFCEWFGENNQLHHTNKSANRTEWDKHLMTQVK